MFQVSQYVCCFSIFTKAVFTVNPEEGLTLTEIAPGLDVQAVVEATECEFKVSCNKLLLIHNKGFIRMNVGSFLIYNHVFHNYLLLSD